MCDHSYEDAILESQESEVDDCVGCFYKENCRNQCERIQLHWNPMISSMVERGDIK